MTAAEIEIFRALHGEDAVLDIKETGEAKRSGAEERARIRDLYANPEKLNSLQLKQKNDMLRNLFGHDRLPLPEDLTEVAPRDEEDEIDTVEAAPPPVKRTRVPKPGAESFAE
ncbi:MAG: hypothetical protein ACXWLO_05105 [Rhizomicrobium sp.]